MQILARCIAILIALAIGAVPLSALGAFVKEQIEVWRRAVREAGIPQE